jgi:hypothetical protein
MVDNSAGFTSANIAIANTYQVELAAIIDAIDANLEVAAIQIVGLTAVKKFRKELIASKGASIAAAMFAYGIDAGLLSLTTEMKSYVKSYLLALRDEDITAAVQDIHDKALALVTVTPPAVNPLIPYGVLAGEVTVFQSDINDYSAVLTTPEAAIENRKAYNTYLLNNFTAADALIKKTDKVIDSIQMTAPDLYIGYYTARTIIGPNTSHTKIRGDVKDSLTGSLLVGVTVKGMYGPDGTIATTTDDSGHYILYTPKFKLLYVVQVEMPGYHTVQVPNVKVKLGKSTIKNIRMNPIE